MKLLLILIFVAQVSYAQTSDEWLQQKKMQRKYLLQQIAALKMYGGYLAKGYSIAKGGLKSIADLKRGSLQQDDRFFELKRIVSPKVKSYQKVRKIAIMAMNISKVTQQTSGYGTRSGHLSFAEQKYFDQVFSNVKNACANDVERLVDIITNSKLAMTDDERIAAIDALYESMLDKKVFIEQFSADIKGVVLQRVGELRETKRSKKLNGIR